MIFQQNNESLQSKTSALNNNNIDSCFYVGNQDFKTRLHIISLHLYFNNSPSCLFHQQAKRTKKVGVVGKYGVRYGASLRKQVKKMEITQHSKYTCTFCGRDAVKRQAVGIWKCRGCKKTMAGGAWTLSTTAAATVRSTTRRLREIMEV
ncbi:60S ribosomal protein L43 [Lobosporangium transversale]|uniref:Ribosomal L37ae protein family-domain-containing protein n=2 Tax=Mortierellaceae TaxID=4854 RepID=A0A1Y2GVC5_9FUNG|nr:ribosomal L37ae protein family-domain-containing protein [Lobosporangium transversale]KAF9915411.1 60S ribosomal protein L43 [Lobosporangium transversale]ORZ19999.1 ribosomal L37ae protein family-domain-containing protein [Lobosporangium transversale]|eukprot:XP_021882539.1 ribosomal L37ae protein family-domain-containing protein [Lobosporangium transversale]